MRDWARRLRVASALALVLCAAVFAAVVYCYLDAAETIDRRLASGYLTSRAGLYAAPRVLRAGQNFSRERLVETLRRAGYVEESASDVWSGAFRATADGAVEISPRRTSHAEEGAMATTAVGFSPEVVRVDFDRKGRIREITGDGVRLEAFTLEPEALTNESAEKTGTRVALAYADIPPVLASAIRAIEDRRFFAHHGLDATGIGRALLSWTGNGTGAPERQGGSTITQQLVKNTYLTPERTLSRKFNEALLAAALERRLSKEDIFALYCNEIYLGQRGAFAVRGVKQAARVYFGKDLRDLSLDEAATIAGMIQSPARYAPDRHPTESRARRDAVLAAMLRDNSINAEEARAASGEATAVAPLDPSARANAPYFIDYVNRALEAQLHKGGAEADERSLRVYTTIDLDLQQLAEQAVARQLAQLERVYKSAGGDARPQAALVALDPQTGHVLAMVGGQNYAASQLNRATDARRQPGSVFKPIVYAAALESGISPARLFADAPRAFNFDRHSPAYRPSNYGGGYSLHDVTMRTALTKSLNVVTVDLAMQTGLPRIAALAESFGLPKAPAYPSLALGTTGTTPLEIASAYTAFANGGTRTRPSSITRAVDAGGRKLFEEFLPSSGQVVQPATAYMITDMLTNVLEEGTARAARGMLKLSAIAGKTGTSRDGWFVGYTPRLVCVVYIGFDDNRQLGLTGGESALPVWAEFMRGALELRPELGGAAFLRPENVTSIEVDPASGQLASPSCPVRERIAVTHALAPTTECLTHRTILPLLDTASATQPAPTATGVAPTDTMPVAVASTRAHSSHGRAAPVVLPAPSIQTTRVEQSRNGRARLTNDPQIILDRAARQ